MIKIRRSEDRGYVDHGWLKARHTFSFADYFDPQHMRFGPLRVINEDRIAGGRGFGPHPHKDMEIITFIISGALQHEDSMGNKSIIRPGEVQKMTAGTGVVHSETNPDTNQETHLLQIWIVPQQSGLKPSYGQKSFASELQSQSKVLAASRDGRDGSIQIHQDADVFLFKVRAQASLSHPLKPGRQAWLQIIRGEATIQDQAVRGGDGVAVSAEDLLEIVASAETDAILFDLPT
jgi:redox-sensitive bicupin YhaK (pirin superfamily)